MNKRVFAVVEELEDSRRLEAQSLDSEIKRKNKEISSDKLKSEQEFDKDIKRKEVYVN